MPAILRALVLALIVVMLGWPRGAAAAPGFTDSCDRAMAKEELDELLAALRAGAGQDGCTLLHVDTSMYRTHIEWRVGEQTLVALLGPRGCVSEPSHEGETLAYHAPAELAASCPAAAAGLQGFVGEPRESLVPVVRGEAPPIDAEAESGRLRVDDPLVIAGLGWLAALVLGVIALVQLWRRAGAGAGTGASAGTSTSASTSASTNTDTDTRRFAGAALVLFAVGLAARFAAAPSMGNWYGAFLPPEGLGELRFGPSAAVLQGCVRALSSWTDGHAFTLARVSGALAVPLVMLLVRRLGGSLIAAVIAGSLLALEPIPVRLSASSSEHVLAGTLALGAWAAWMRSAVDRSAVPRLAGAVLMLLAVLARVDCWPQLVAIPLWSLLAVPADAPGRQPLARRLGDAVFFWSCWALIGVYGWFRIVVPSNHPGPDPDGVRATLQVLVTQLWVAAAEPPHWLTPTCVLLAVLGVIAALARRRVGLLIAAVLGWTLIFVPLGRNLTHDGLTGARYFVLALPLLAVLAAELGEPLARVSTRISSRWRTLALGVGALAFLLIERAAAQPGWQHELTFQAEYRFLAEQLRDRELDGCTLWFVPPRQPTGEPDLDCCLAPDRSPLSLVAPGLSFRPIPGHRELDDAAGCHLYYLGSLCSIDPELAPRVPKGVARIREQCDRLRTHGGVDVWARQELSDQSLSPRWQRPPLVELFGRGHPQP